MEKIYERFDDVNVRNFVVYGKAADSKLYYEPDYKTQVTQNDLENAFVKGALMIVDGSSKLVPIVLTNNTVKTVKSGSTALEFATWSAAAN